MTTKFTIATKNKLPQSMLEMTISIEASDFSKYREKAIHNLSHDLDIPGFRRGHIPPQIIVSKVGESGILQEAAEVAIKDVYPDIVEEAKISPIGKPDIEITKLAPENPLEFKITVSLVPEINLPEYQKIAEEIKTKGAEEKIEVTEKDIEDVTTNIRKNMAEQKSTDTNSSTNATPALLPVFDNDMAKAIGYESVEDFKNKISADILEHKKKQAKEKRRIELAGKLVENSKVDMPEILIQSELHKMESEFKDDIERMGAKMDDYLKEVKKTIEDLRKEWRDSAEKRAKLQLVLNEIAIKEQITLEEEKIKHEMSHIMEHYKNADPTRVRIYVETILTNEKVFEKLES